MLSKEDIIKICNSLNLCPEEYCVGYGGALVLHGVKASTADIDINVTEEVFKRLSQNYSVDHAMFDEPYIEIDGVVDVFTGSSLGEKTLIDGIPAATLQHIIAAKRRLGRPKDLEDIRLIEEFIKKDK